MLNWKRNTWRDVFNKLKWPLVVAGTTLVFCVLGFGFTQTLAAGGIALSIFLILGAVAVLAHRRLRTMPFATWGMALAHAGLGVTVIGITAVTAWQTSKVLDMNPGQTVELAGQQITLQSVADVDGPNYHANQARFRVVSHSGERVLISERRFYSSSGTQTTQAGIGTGLLGNIYIAIGDTDANGLVVRLWDHPFVDWIWAGALMMAFGGALSLADRRFRLGAPARATTSVMAAA